MTYPVVDLTQDAPSKEEIAKQNAEAQEDKSTSSLYPRPFVLERAEDVTGVSGTGVVAEGVEFSTGVVALQWLSEWPTSVVFHQRGVASVIAVHGHDGKTQLVWTDVRA